MVACGERGITPDNTLFLGGGIIPDEDVEVLKDAGFSAVFGPGAHTGDIAEYVRAHVPELDRS